LNVQGEEQNYNWRETNIPVELINIDYIGKSWTKDKNGYTIIH
jgi:hypothetical protein